MNRRQLLKLLALGVAGQVIDIDRLLWVPNTKKIFIPRTTGLSMSQIVAVELERTLPHIRTLFERDDMFYQAIKRNTPVVSNREIRVPLTVAAIDWGKDESYTKTVGRNVGKCGKNTSTDSRNN